MATLADRILQTLRVASRALDDDELASRLGVIRQQINQACNRLASQGLLSRYVGPQNKLVNEVTDGHGQVVPSSRRAEVRECVQARRH